MKEDELSKEVIESFKNTSKDSEERTKQHNIGNVIRDFNGKSHEGGKFLTYQRNHNKNYLKSKNIKQNKY